MEKFQNAALLLSTKWRTHSRHNINLFCRYYLAQGQTPSWPWTFVNIRLFQAFRNLRLEPLGRIFQGPPQLGMEMWGSTAAVAGSWCGELLAPQWTQRMTSLYGTHSHEVRRLRLYYSNRLVVSMGWGLCALAPPMVSYFSINAWSLMKLIGKAPNQSSFMLWKYIRK